MRRAASRRELRGPRRPISLHASNRQTQINQSSQPSSIPGNRETGSPLCAREAWREERADDEEEAAAEERERRAMRSARRAPPGSRMVGGGEARSVDVDGRRRRRHGLKAERRGEGERTNVLECATHQAPILLTRSPVFCSVLRLWACRPILMRSSSKWWALLLSASTARRFILLSAFSQPMAGSQRPGGRRRARPPPQAELSLPPEPATLSRRYLELSVKP
jgi:hypothetical protein